MSLPSPTELAQVPREKLPTLLREVNLLQAQILERMTTEQSAATDPTESDDVLLSIEDAAPRLGVSRTWLYRNAKKLPFTRRIGSRAVRFSSRGIARYLASRRFT